MNTRTTPAQEATPDVPGSEMTEQLQALCQLVDLGQDDFTLGLVEFALPRLRQHIIDRLHEAFPNLRIVTANLTPPPADAAYALNVLDQLQTLVQQATPDAPPEVLIITGLERLLPDPTESATGHDADVLRRAIQPLNLGRNMLAELFPCPVLICLPPDAMAVFLRHAPDLRSWQSGFFHFHADAQAVTAELTREAQPSKRRYLRRWQPEDLYAEAQHLEGLIATPWPCPSNPVSQLAFIPVWGG